MNKSMFVFVIFTVFFNENCESRQIARQTAKYKDGVKEEIVAAIQRCNAGERLPEMVKLIVEGKYVEDDFFKNFIHCGFKESGYSLENGRINIEKATQAFEVKNDEMFKVIKECDVPVGDPVANTYAYFKCFQDKTPTTLDL